MRLYTSVAIYPFGWPTWSPSPEGYGNISSTYAFCLSAELAGLWGISGVVNTPSSAQIFCHFCSISAWLYRSSAIYGVYTISRTALFVRHRVCALLLFQTFLLPAGNRYFF